MRRRTLLRAGSLMPLLSPAMLAGPAFAQTTSRQPAAGKGVTGKVALFNGRATLFLDDKPVYPWSYSLTDTPGGRWTWEELCRENIENFTQARVSLMQV